MLDMHRRKVVISCTNKQLLHKAILTGNEQLRNLPFYDMFTVSCRKKRP